jgi:hypothetical protein
MRRICAVLVLVIGCGSNNSGSSSLVGGSSTGGSQGTHADAAAGGASGTTGGGAGAGGTGGLAGAGGIVIGGTDAGVPPSDGDLGGSTGGGGALDGGSTNHPDAELMSAVGDASSLAADAAPVSPDGAPLSPDAAAAPTPDSAVALSPDTASLPVDAAPVAVDVAPDMAPLQPDAAPPTPDAAPVACVPATPIGCATGSFCSIATQTCLPETGALHFTFTDSCATAGAQVDVKLFDETNGGGWPVEGIVYVIPFAMTKTIDIACIPGAKVCFGGADHATGSLYWVVSLDNSQSCVNCCVTCGLGTNVQPQNLLCQ